MQSIAHQSFTDYEVVLIDGGSTDNTLAIIKDSPIVNKTVRVVPGIGLYTGLNRGIDNALGEWHYFIGCDDQLYQPDTLRRVAEVLQISLGKVFAGSVQYANGFHLAPRLGSPYLMQFILHHQGTFYHRSITEQYRYNEAFGIASDYELNVRLRLAKVPCSVLSDTIALYGEGGVSSVHYRKNFAEVRAINRRLFTGLARPWVVGYCWVKQSIWLARNELGLLNLKHRLLKSISIGVFSIWISLSYTSPLISE